MLKINDLNLINPSTLLNKFYIEGRNTDLLEMTNSQLFKYIDGVGEGAFLMEAADAPTAKTCKLNTFNTRSLQDYTTSSGDTADLSSRIDYTLLVKDKFVLNFQSTNPVVLIYTRELKAVLEETFATRNYNVIDQKSIYDDTVYIVHPDRTPKQFTAILADISPGLTVVFDSPSKPTPYNFFVQGMNLVQLIDLYCKAYGLIWTCYYNAEEELTVHIFALSEITPSVSFVSDINFQYLPLPAYKVETVHPIIDCCLKSPQNYTNKANTDSGNKTIQIYCPYYPAIADIGSTAPSGVSFDAPELDIVNEADINQCSAFIQDNLNNYSLYENHYFVNYFINPVEPSATPQHTEIRYHFNGSGYRTYFFSGRYQGIPIPHNKPEDKQARNVIGYLEYSYKQSEESLVPVPYFLVKPLYGLDGWIDVNLSLPVINIFKWNFGFSESIIRIEWDCTNRRWIPVQQEYFCPPETEFPEVPSPPPEETKVALEWEE
jgi:hypothetical protein